MSKKMMIAYNIVETGKLDNDNQPITYWNRIGTAWENKDGSFNVILNSIPLDGKVHLRVPKEQDNGK